MLDFHGSSMDMKLFKVSLVVGDILFVLIRFINATSSKQATTDQVAENYPGIDRLMETFV